MESSISPASVTSRGRPLLRGVSCARPGIGFLHLERLRALRAPPAPGSHWSIQTRRRSCDRENKLSPSGQMRQWCFQSKFYHVVSNFTEKHKDSSFTSDQRTFDLMWWTVEKLQNTARERIRSIVLPALFVFTRAGKNPAACRTRAPHRGVVAQIVFEVLCCASSEILQKRKQVFTEERKSASDTSVYSGTSGSEGETCNQLCGFPCFCPGFLTFWQSGNIQRTWSCSSSRFNLIVTTNQTTGSESLTFTAAAFHLEGTETRGILKMFPRLEEMERSSGSAEATTSESTFSWIHPVTPRDSLESLHLFYLFIWALLLRDIHNVLTSIFNY